MSTFLRAARDRADVVSLAVLGIAVFAVPGIVPGGIYGLGLISGSALALHAIALVLVYRTNRIVNFAQIQVGVVAGVLFRLLVEQATVMRGVRAVCEPCAVGGAGGRAIVYWTSLAIAILVAAALGFVIERVIVRRFTNAPRLVLTVATIGVAQLLASVQASLPGILATAEQRELSRVPVGPAAPPPLDLSFRWYPAVFRASDVLTVAVAVAAVAALFVWLRYSRRGVAVRASSENAERAATLGIDVAATTRRVWLIAGVLSGAAGILGAMSGPAPPPASIDVAVMVRILAAAVIASMASLPLAGIAALVLGAFDQAMLWRFGSSALVDGTLAALIAGVLMVQRARTSRVEQELAGAWRAAREVRPVPRELRGLGALRRWTRTGAGAGILAVLALPFVLSPSQANSATIMLIFGIVAMSLLILSGWAGQISLGQFALAGIGGYVASLAAVEAHVPMLLAIVAGSIAGAIVAVVVGLPALKMRGLHLAITTLAFALTTSAVLLSPSVLGRYLPDVVPRGGVIGVDLNDHRAYYYFTLLVLAGVVAATAGMRRSRFGRGLIAARDNELAAQAFGADVVRTRLVAFAISGAMAALAGSLYAFHQYGVKPASFTPDVSVAMFLMVVIGGLGSIAGALSGAAYLGALTLLSVSPLVLFLATGGGVIVLLLFVPGGIGQFLYDVRDALLRRIARRHGIEVPSLLADARPGRGDARAPIAPRIATTPLAARYRLATTWGPQPDPDEVTT